MGIQPDFFGMDVKSFAEMAYGFMTGLPGWGSSGFRMMGPDELRRQRWTFAKFWWERMNKERKEIITMLND